MHIRMQAHCVVTKQIVFTDSWQIGVTHKKSGHVISRIPVEIINYRHESA